MWISYIHGTALVSWSRHKPHTGLKSMMHAFIGAIHVVVTWIFHIDGNSAMTSSVIRSPLRWSKTKNILPRNLFSRFQSYLLAGYIQLYRLPAWYYILKNPYVIIGCLAFFASNTTGTSTIPTFYLFMVGKIFFQIISNEKIPECTTFWGNRILIMSISLS